MRNEVIKILKKHTSFDINDSTTMEEIGLSSFDIFCIISELEENEMHVNYDKLALVKMVKEFIEAVNE